MGRWVAQAAFLLVSLSGCAKNADDADDTGTAGTAGTAGSRPIASPPDATCMAGQHCKCANGEIGTTTCSEPTVSCDCAGCPAFAPSALAPDFAPCGGAPEGRWRTRNYDLAGVVAHFAVAVLDQSTEISCAADLSVVTPPDLGLVLNSDGSAEVAYTAPAVSATVLDACVEDGLKRSCDQIPTCIRTDCGTCRCSLTALDVSEPKARWSQSGRTLTIGQLSLGYCVKGDIMTVLNRVNGMLFELEKVVVPEQTCAGSANECGLNQTEEDCKLVRGCSVVTACLGDAVRTCDYLVDVCTVCPAGCQCEFSLGQSQCAGQAYCPDMTTQADCVGLGCEWQAIAGCGGIPDPCDSLTVAECRFTPGCKVQ